jgi:hypothetical protein
MNNNFAKNAFIKWLSINNHRFNNLPCNIRQENDLITFNLSGITKILQWELSETGAFLTVRETIPFNKDHCTFWDGLMDFDVYEEQSATGEYFCDLCDKQYRQYYPSIIALWESHCFENILDWSNKKLTADKILCLYQFGKGSTSANLLSSSEWDSHKQKHNDTPYKVVPIQTNSLSVRELNNKY